VSGDAQPHARHEFGHVGCSAVGVWQKLLMQQPAVRQQQICPAEQHWLPQQLWPAPQLVPSQGAAVQPVAEQ
jgi:hypothetical protein